MERKTDKFKMSKVTIAVTVAVVALVSITFLLISSVLLLLMLLYHLHYGCKLLRITRSIVERKTDKFKISGVAVAFAITVVAFVSRTFLSILSN